MTEGPARVRGFQDAYAVVIGDYRMTEYTSEESIAQDQADRINRALESFIASRISEALAPLVEKAKLWDEVNKSQVKFDENYARLVAKAERSENVSKAAERMEKYAYHDGLCKALEDEGCSCGYVEALAAWKKANEKEV